MPLIDSLSSDERGIFIIAQSQTSKDVERQKIPELCAEQDHKRQKLKNARGRPTKYNLDRILIAYWLYTWSEANASIRGFCKSWPGGLSERTFRKMRAEEEKGSLQS